ncbi:MAG TPA: ActS/PrrB/RegB family redox-sensitive histidine kinase [Geminicoccaceae bacterium]|nr:ActS/PrrB/RegB family redox-sensitive histidine kinase [Geminicoccaceae bacterium]
MAEGAERRRAAAMGDADDPEQGFLTVLRRLRPSLGVLVGFLESEHGRVRLHTITVTRWLTVGGQLFTILFVHFSLDIPLPLVALLPAVLLSAAINIALVVGLRANTRLSENSAALLFAFDIVQLWYVLVVTGGLQNPFATLILFPVTLAATTLGGRWTVLLAALAVVGVALLALLSGELPWRNGRLSLPPLYLAAHCVALDLTIVLVAGFTWSLAEEARRRSGALAAAQVALGREQQLSALGGQAAAAAHLLGTPLATINIIAKELVRELPEGSVLAEEAQVLLDQAKRCRDLMKVIGQPPDAAAQRFTRSPLTVVLEEIAREVGRPEITVDVRPERLDESDEPLVVPTPELRHSLANLIDNAIQFATSRVDITLRSSATGVTLIIEDDGPGFSPRVLDWLGEPYLSTRRNKGGLGLGVFIAITLLARTGGKLHFANKTTRGQKGASVTVTWPRAALDPVVAEGQ